MASGLLDPSWATAPHGHSRNDEAEHSPDGAMSPVIVTGGSRNGGGRSSRKLVLCFDGTGNKFHGDDSDSNILKIFRMLDRTAGDQYHYYQRERPPPRSARRRQSC